MELQRSPQLRPQTERRCRSSLVGQRLLSDLVGEGEEVVVLEHCDDWWVEVFK